MTDRRPVHKRVVEGAAAAHRTTRAALAADVGRLCVERLATAGFDWTKHERRARNVGRVAWAREDRPEGKGRPLDDRALLVRELDFKLWFGGKEGPSPEQLACLWLLLRGIGSIPAGKIAKGLDAPSVLTTETGNFKKALARHGQQTPSFPANKYVVVDGKATIEPAADADKVFEQRDPNGELLYRYGMKRAKLPRRGFGKRSRP